MKPYQRNVSSKFGAPMGRASDLISGAVKLDRVPFVDGDYDEGGAYWGNGEPLWCAFNDEGARYFRAPDRAAAIAVLSDCDCTVEALTRETIVSCIADLLWAEAFVSYMEDEERSGNDPDRCDPGAGGSWDSLVPPTPDEVKEGAERLALSIEKMNGASLDVLYQRAASMKGKHHKKPTAERFGECIAWEACGSGISWSDDHPDHGFKIPEIEVYTDDGKTADVGRVDERFV